MSDFDITKSPREVQQAVLLCLCQEAVVSAVELDIERLRDRLARASYVAAIINLTDRDTKAA